MSDVAMRFGSGLERGSTGERVADIAPTLPRVATVDVHSDPRAVLAEWRSLVADAPVSPYQTPDWLIPWTETIGASLGIRPMLVIARDERGSPLALLPFGITRRGGLKIAAFLGGKDANFHMGVFRRGGPVWTRAAVRDLLRRAATACGDRVDLYALRNQPLAWQGLLNPFATLDQQPSPSFAYLARLAPDAEAFFKVHLSRESRKKVRQKTARLKGLGDVEIFRAETAADVSEVLDALMEQRRQRCEALGLPADDFAGLRRFLDRVTVPTAAPVVEVHALRCGGEIIATLVGARRDGRFSGMLTSFVASPEYARASPGELLLAEVMRRCCEEGLSVFDLGIGEARYKETYCPEAEPLFDTVVAITLPGRIATLAEILRLRIKRTIKQSPWAWSLVQRLRKVRASASGGLADRTAAGQD